MKAMATPQVKKKGDPHCSKWLVACVLGIVIIFDSASTLLPLMHITNTHKSLNKILLSHIYR